MHSQERRRVLILGNCHSQYLGAALKHLTSLDVQVAGRPFEGPVHFQGTVAKTIDLKGGLAWLQSAVVRPILIVQSTPGSRYDLSERLMQRGIAHDVVRVPFIRFGVLDIFKIEGDGKAKISREIRRDRIFNEMSILSAGADVSSLDEIEAYMRAEPSFYMNSHFTGGVLSRIFQLMRGSEIENALGSERFEEFLAQVSVDAGIGHLFNPLPAPEVQEALGFDWDLRGLIIENDRGLSSMASFRSPSNGVVSYGLFRMRYQRYIKYGSRADMLVCFRLYKDKKYYLKWAEYIIDAFIREGRPARAAVVLFNRLRFEDARGSALALALPRLHALSRSAEARRVAERFAATNSKDSAALAAQVLMRLG